MKWYLAKLVFQILCGSGKHTPQFDEQLRLVYAEDALHAFHKARLLGEGDCLATGETVAVKWKFIDVTELHTLVPDTDGAEMYSIIKEEADPNQYIRSAYQKGNQLLQLGLYQFTGLNSVAIGT